ncbi:glycine-rich protein 2-like [Miscanthus floridulus]|uniref:glycine-rich protein 2-like n=1 Tax=Miscanthus floridulus TaxID=154761 RepID=UPI00345AD182
MLPHLGDRTTAATNPNPAALEGRDSGEGGRPGGGEAGGWFRGPSDGGGGWPGRAGAAMAGGRHGRCRRGEAKEEVVVGGRVSSEFAAAAARGSGRWEVVEVGHSCGGGGGGGKGEEG